MKEVKIGWFASISKFEKIFWVTILILLILFVVLQFLASRHHYQEESKAKERETQTEVFKEVELLIDTHTMRTNLDTNATLNAILGHLHRSTLELNQTIEVEIEKLFGGVDRNLEQFLDFHYSVIGEYVELGAMATGEIEQQIEERLFGKLFIERTNQTLESIAKHYHILLKNHLDFIHTNATQGVDTHLNLETLERLTADIRQNILIQQGKLATLMSAAVATKIVKAIATKAAIKQASKITVKTASKAAVKGAAAASGASAGVFCGPLVWVCAPVAATAMWFGTDAAIVTVDEHFNRDEFRSDILSSLTAQKQNLKHQLQTDYTQSLQTLSTQTLKKYQETPTKVKKRVKIKELIGK